ncbi:MAG: hypothetical protein KUG69_10335 [Marinosulfonomonas sp.]|nr:hypothetical protein [Marinosulfonomonas sp.]
MKVTGSSRFEQITGRAALHEAWRRVRRNGGGAGGDKVTPKWFEHDLDDRLRHLSRALSESTYKPGPLRRIVMRRKDGRARILRIPTITDRVVQTACQIRLSAELDPHMSRDSYGYRPARSVAQALTRVRKASRNGQAWALDADIERFFDNVSHARLLDDLAIWINDPRLLALIRLWLLGFGGGKGLAQGAPISPLMANLYLHPLDRAFATEGILMVRYADDFVVLVRDESAAKAARAIAASTLNRRGLQLNNYKTNIVRLADGFDFLGERVVWPE